MGPLGRSARVVLRARVHNGCSVTTRTPLLRSLLVGLALAGAASAGVQGDSGPASAGSQRPAGERSGERGGPAWRRAALQGESLASVRALFQRVDVDGDGNLDVREADHGGIDWTRQALSDFDGDRRLDLEEFTVARQRELARRGELAAPNLVAESTRIQALWRARSARGVPEGRATVLDDESVARLKRLLGPAPTPGPPLGALAPWPSNGPAQARLSDALGSSAAQTAERARRAQMLLELRRGERDK